MITGYSSIVLYGYISITAIIIGYASFFDLGNNDELSTIGIFKEVEDDGSDVKSVANVPIIDTVSNSVEKLVDLSTPSIDLDLEKQNVSNEQIGGNSSKKKSKSGKKQSKSGKKH